MQKERRDALMHILYSGQEWTLTGKRHKQWWLVKKKEVSTSKTNNNFPLFCTRLSMAALLSVEQEESEQRAQERHKKAVILSYAREWKSVEYSFHQQFFQRLVEFHKKEKQQQQIAKELALSFGAIHQLYKRCLPQQLHKTHQLYMQKIEVVDVYADFILWGLPLQMQLLAVIEKALLLDCLEIRSLRKAKKDNLESELHVASIELNKYYKLLFSRRKQEVEN